VDISGVLSLIDFRQNLEGKFGSARFKKKDVWKEVADAIKSATGLKFSASQVCFQFVLCILNVSSIGPLLTSRGAVSIVALPSFFEIEPYTLSKCQKYTFSIMSL